MNVYFPNLNGVRAIAALMVIVFHIEMVKTEFNIAHPLKFMELGGNLGVSLFFVLSGFLITYLLITEKKISGFISIKNFYIRRILRIWPLYITVCILGLFVVPYLGALFYEPAYAVPQIANKFVVIFLYFLFLANVLTGTDSHVNFLRPMWSVSVEEQFYLIWPVLMNRFFGRKTFVVYFLMIYIALRLVFATLSSHFFTSRFPNIPFNSFYEIINYTPFDSLCIGALTAVLLERYNNGEFVKLVEIIFHKRFQQALFILIPLLIYVIHIKINLHYTPNVTVNFTKTFYSFLFAAAILNLAANPNVIISLENKLINFLGKISFGLYLYHWFLIVLLLNVLKKYDMVNNITLYFGSLILTVMVSALSYYFMELKFLNLKHRFSKIHSGDFVKK